MALPILGQSRRRFRSLGDGQVDFTAIFSKLTQYDYAGWAVLEWECCIKSSEQGAAEGAPFIKGTSSRQLRALRRFRRSRHRPECQPCMLGLA